VICPWCYIGKRRLEQALELLGGQQDFQVLWRPFELNPEMPREGIDRRAYRTAKFGSWRRSLELDAHLAAVGKQVGITFRFVRMTRTSNTFDAHRLIGYAQAQGCQNGVVEKLFDAYFTEGQNIGDRRVLADLAAEAGLDRAEVERLLESDQGTDEVRLEVDRGRRLGIGAVPHFLIDGTHPLSGAIEPGTIVAALQRAAGQRRA
jgi:predicted DsbA family dithiol-disulfide isomerase